MRILVVIATLCALSSPAQSQEGDGQEGIDLMGEALRLFMQGLMQEMEPALEEMEGFFQELDAYHPPEVLPNGDIIIRRKQRPEPLPEGETEI